MIAAKMINFFMIFLLVGYTIIYEFTPAEYSKIPQFNPILPEFWKSITSAVVLRTASTFSKNVADPGKEELEGEKKEMKGGEKSGAKQNVSGGA